MEVERKIKHGGVVGTMKVGGMVQVEDENEQNVISVCRERGGGEEEMVERSVIAGNECETDRRTVWKQQMD